MKYKISAVLTSIVLATTGCAIKGISHGSEISESQAAKIEVGKTTKHDVYLEFGNPTKMMDNDKVFFYNWTRGSKVQVLGLGQGDATTFSLVVVFDKNDVVKNYKMTRGATESAINVND